MLSGLVFGGLAGFVVVLLGWKLGWRKSLSLTLAVLLGAAAGIAGSRMFGDLLPIEIPDAVNNRQGTTFWELASDAGLRAKVIRVPATFPAEEVAGGTMLSGLGVPDARGGLGDWFVYTTDPDEDNREGRSTTTAGTVFRHAEIDRGQVAFMTDHSQFGLTVPSNTILYWDGTALTKVADDDILLRINNEVCCVSVSFHSTYTNIHL